MLSDMYGHPVSATSVTLRRAKSNEGLWVHKWNNYNKRMTNRLAV